MLPLLFAALLQAPAPSATLESSLRSAIARSGAEVAVAYRTLDGRSEVLIDPDKDFHAASTMKVPVMIELFRQVAAGTVKLDDTIVIRNEFHSIVDGSVYTLSEGDDSDKEVYAAVGRPMTLRRLCELMITVSSNFAANILIEKVGVENVRRTVTALGADGMHVLRGVEDQKAFDKGLNNTTSARALMVLFDSLAHGKAVDAVRRRNDRDPRAAAVQRRDPGWPARRNRGGSQDRQHHPDPPRCRDRLRPAPVRAGDPGARDRRSEEERRFDGRPVATGVRRDQPVGTHASSCVVCRTGHTCGTRGRSSAETHLKDWRPLD